MEKIDIAKIREETKNELEKKYSMMIDPITEGFTLRPYIGRGPGNFVSGYIPRRERDHYTERHIDREVCRINIQTVEYHLRMLETTRHLMEVNTSGEIKQMLRGIAKDIDYSESRIQNAMTFLENIRAEMIYERVLMEMRQLSGMNMKKDMLVNDVSVMWQVSTYFDKNGYVKPYMETEWERYERERERNERHRKEQEDNRRKE